MSVTAVPIPPVKRRYLVWLWLGVLLAVAGAAALAWKGTEAYAPKQDGTNRQFLAWNARQPGVQTTASGLQYQVIEPGQGPSPTETDMALVTYTGAFRDGKIFDQSPQPVPMSVGGTIPGFSEGLKLMKKGSKYRFWIKPELAYGSRTPDPQQMPPNSLLVFEVSLFQFIPQQMYQQMLQMQQMRGGAPGGAAPQGR